MRIILDGRRAGVPKKHIITTLIVISFSLTMLIALIPNVVLSESTVDWSLSIPGEEPQYDNGTAILVAGIEHNLTFYIGVSDNITVSLTYSELKDGDERNTTNSYVWTYRDSHFSDELYDTYINKSACSVFSDNIAFHIGIHAEAHKGTWLLKVDRNIGGSRVENIILENISVKKAISSFALSTPLFEFRVEPFETGDKIPPTVKDYKFRTINTGNVPLWIYCEYDKLGEIFYTTNMSIISHPDESVDHQIYLTSLPWSPQVFTVTEHVKGKALHTITPEMISFIPIYQNVVKINVKVVRSGFNILDIGPAKLQYEQGPKVAAYDETMDIRLFASGHSDASLTISVDKLELVAIYYDGYWHNNSDAGVLSHTIYLHLTNDSDEEEIMVRVHCYREKVTGKVNYVLSSGSDSGRDRTEIVVGSAPYVPPGSDEKNGINTFALIGVIIVMLIVAALMVFYKKRIHEDE